MDASRTPDLSATGSTDLWIQRFRVSTILWTAIARGAPTRGLAAGNQSGRFQLYAWDVPGGTLRQLTDRHQGTMFGTLAPDGSSIYYLDDQGGNEIGHFVRVPFEGGAPEDLTPRMPPYAGSFVNSSLMNGVLGFTTAMPDGFHVYGLVPDQDDPRQLYHSGRLTFGPFLSSGGEIGVVQTTERSGTLNSHLLAFDTHSGDLLAELWEGPESDLQAVAFAPVAGDFRLLATSNRSGSTRPLIWNPRTGECTDLVLGDLAGDVMALDWSSDGSRVLLVQFNRAAQQLYTYDLDTARLHRLDHRGGAFGFGGGLGVYFGPGDREIFAQWEDATHSPRLVALDAETGQQTRTLLTVGEDLPGRPWTSITFPSTDGQEIQGWLAVPEGEGPFPTILETHGGPSAVQTEDYSPSSQMWLDHGFAYLTINYRGSTTFGRAFQEQIVGDLGHWEVEDLVAARDWLVQNHIARPDQILLTGWSYGGYLTLMGLGKTPDLWAGGMAGITIADWTIQYEDTSDSLRGYQVALLGGTPQERPEQYAASSPITYVEQVNAPVLIIQGRNDTRTPARPVEMYAARLAALGKSFELHWFETGHLGPFADAGLRVEHHRWMLDFARRVLG